MSNCENNQKQIDIKALFMKKYQPSVSLRTLSAQVKLEELKNYSEIDTKFFQQYIEIGIEKGLCWIDQNDQIHFLVDVENNDNDILNFLHKKFNKPNINKISYENIKLKNILNLCVDTTYNTHIDIVSEKIKEYPILDNAVEQLLKVYKYGDEKIVNKFYKFISLFYYASVKQNKDVEQLYFIAKKCLLENESLRKQCSADYLKNYIEFSSKVSYRLRRLFLYEDLQSDSDKLNKEKIKYIIQSGICDIEKLTDEYKISYMTYIHNCKPDVFLECIRELHDNYDIVESDLEKYFR